MLLRTTLRHILKSAAVLSKKNQYMKKKKKKTGIPLKLPSDEKKKAIVKNE